MFNERFMRDFFDLPNVLRPHLNRPAPKVYLAGPIAGLTYDEGQDWRTDAAKLLADEGLVGYSPLRAQQYRRADGPLHTYNMRQDHPLSSDRGVTTRDRWDVMTADAILFYLNGAKIVSIGTCIEFGWADILRKPAVVVMEKEGNIHEHPMIHELIHYRVETLPEAVDVLSKILNPWNEGD